MKIYIAIFLILSLSCFLLTALENNKDNISDKIINDLPVFVKKKIASTEENYLNFINHYKNLEKDEELLLLVNKKNSLSPDYIPKDLVETKDIIPSIKNSCLLRNIILADLIDMFNDAKKEQINLITVSGYRSYDMQKKTHEYWINELGEEEALKVSAKPGLSQHQLGTAIDFNSLKDSFAATPEGKWLLNNSYRYGFVLSYPEGYEDITGYSYEPWHYRYVGKNAAYIIYHYFDNILELFLTWYWGKDTNK